jgi:hypothetical protein
LAALGLLMSYGSYKFSKKMIMSKQQALKKKDSSDDSSPAIKKLPFEESKSAEDNEAKCKTNEKLMRLEIKN